MQDRHRVTGINTPLPEGEKVLWEGSPALKPLVTRVLGVRILMFYLVVMALFATAMTLSGASLLQQFVLLAVVAAVLHALLVVFGRMIVKGTTYAITDQRILIRKGIALESVLNLPFTRISGLHWGQHRDGSGDIAIELAGGRLPYWLLWPHARPWRLFRAQPSLRAIDGVAEVAETLRTAFLKFQEEGGVVSYQPGKAEFRMRDDEDDFAPVGAESSATGGPE